MQILKIYRCSNFGGWNHLLTFSLALGAPPRPPWPWAKAWGFSEQCAHSVPTCALALEASKADRRVRKVTPSQPWQWSPHCEMCPSWSPTPLQGWAPATSTHRPVSLLSPRGQVPQVALTFPCSECPLGLCKSSHRQGTVPAEPTEVRPTQGACILTHQEKQFKHCSFWRVTGSKKMPSSSEVSREGPAEPQSLVSVPPSVWSVKKKKLINRNLN